MLNAKLCSAKLCLAFLPAIELLNAEGQCAFSVLPVCCSMLNANLCSERSCRQLNLNAENQFVLSVHIVIP